MSQLFLDDNAKANLPPEFADIKRANYFLLTSMSLFDHIFDIDIRSAHSPSNRKPMLSNHYSDITQ